MSSAAPEASASTSPPAMSASCWKAVVMSSAVLDALLDAARVRLARANVAVMSRWLTAGRLGVEPRQPQSSALAAIPSAIMTVKVMYHAASTSCVVVWFHANTPMLVATSAAAARVAAVRVRSARGMRRLSSAAIPRSPERNFATPANSNNAAASSTATPATAISLKVAESLSITVVLQRPRGV